MQKRFRFLIITGDFAKIIWVGLGLGGGEKSRVLAANSLQVHGIKEHWWLVN
ncbi:MAG: hypothetical protein L5655_09265 [Thermosediminibacteraceae bacterium]|nr:hypothetical protein [Thermosediminibacteraceae bacterium]